MHKKLLPLGLAIILALGLVVPAFAETATIVLTAGTLSVTVANISFGTVALTGALQTVPGTTTPWTGRDLRGTGGGWHVNIRATDFSDGTHTIAASDMDMQLANANITVVAGNTKPSSNFTAMTPLANTDQSFASAALNQGMGTYNMAPTFQLDIAADAYAGSYSSTVTVTAVASP